MSKTLELPEELYARLEEAAETSGTTPEGWLDQHLPKPQPKPPTGDGKTLRQRLEGLIGNFSSGGQSRQPRPVSPKRRASTSVPAGRPRAYPSK